MEFKGLTLDPFQEEAIAAIDRDHSVMVAAPTGSGKTLIADYLIARELKQAKRVIYTAPLKALSNQKYKEFSADHGEDAIGLITGDVVINRDAQILIMTTEVYRNMVITKDELLDHVSYAIMDEIHFIGDIERGHIWEESIIFSPEHVRFLFLSATIPNADQFSSWVRTIKRHEVRVVHHTERPVPLEIKFYDVGLGICGLEAIRREVEGESLPGMKRRRRGQGPSRPSYQDVVRELRRIDVLPAIYFVFSRKRTQEYAEKLARKQNLLSREEESSVVRQVREEYDRLGDEVKQLDSTKLLRQCLARGVAFHHAGLLPDSKSLVERLFGQGLIKVLFATETFAVGINMPARTVVFDGLRKFTGEGFRYLNSKEFFQIAGRAGRRGIDTHGLAISCIDRRLDDLKRIARFTASDDLPIQSQFRISPNTVLNMVDLHTSEEIEQILRMNLYTFQHHKRARRDHVPAAIRARWESLHKQLTRLGYIERGGLSDLGRFATQIYSSTIEISMLFAGPGRPELDPYAILLCLGAIDYEPRRDIRYHNTYPSKRLRQLVRELRAHPELRKGAWYDDLIKLTAIIKPIHDGEGFLAALHNTTMLEGDLIRFLMRINDKLEQVSRAAHDDALEQKLQRCKEMIRECLEGIQVI